MDKKYSVKELSEMSGLTTRTIQYYDNEGVLKAQRNELGHRVYSKQQLYLLEQIAFYKAIGFSLKKIKKHVIMGTTDEDIKNVLEFQEAVLYTQKESIQAKIDGLAVTKELIKEGYEAPWGLLSRLIRSLNEVDISTWKEYKFHEDEWEIFNKVFPSENMALDFYNSFRKICLQAAAYKASHVPIESDLGASLAKKWEMTILKVTNDDERILSAFLSVDNNREHWDMGEQHLIVEAEDYLEDILKYHQNR